jgi:hypothetical protein
MRSINSRINNLGNQSALRSAKVIVRQNAGSSSAVAVFGALFGYASRYWETMRDALGDWPTVTRTTKRVTGGACHSTTWQGSGRHAAMCRLTAS